MQILIVSTLAVWVLFGGAVVANNGVLFAPSKDQPAMTAIETEARRRGETGSRTIAVPRPPRGEYFGDTMPLTSGER